MSNGIGNISNSQIEKIEQQVQYNTVLSEEIREAILLITSLMTEDLNWKRSERGKIMLERLVVEKRNYSFVVFDKLLRLLLTPLLLYWLFHAWKNIVSPIFRFLSENGFSLINLWRSLLWLGESMIKQKNAFLILLIISIGYMIIMALVSFCIARRRSNKKYRKKFKQVSEQFGLS